MHPMELLTRYRLHDSGVDRLDYDSVGGTLRLQMDLCNHDQPGYQPGEPELLPGRLAFEGVSELTANHPLSSVRWGPNVDGEVLEAQVTTVEAAPERPLVKLVLSVFQYKNRNQAVLVLTFRATDASWQPTTGGRPA